jgi:hypothetical protein
MKKHLLSIFLFLFFLSLTGLSFAQGNGNGGNNGGNQYQITGNQQPCVGSTETYTITPNPGNNIVWEWDGPRAQANEVEWQVISSSNNQITFRVGDKPGTIRAKPTPGSNNTENLAVHPGKALEVALDGPTAICGNTQQIFKVVINNLNRGSKGNKGIKEEDLDINWILPTGLSVLSGQNTSSLTVLSAANFTGGTVRVRVNVPAVPGGPGNNGNGIGPITGFCGGAAEASLVVGLAPDCPTTPLGCVAPLVSIAGPAVVCPSQAQMVTFRAVVPNATATMNYRWSVPNGWFISSGQGTGAIEVRVGNTAGQVSVIATNNCQLMASAVQAILLESNCGTNPPVCPTNQVNISGPATLCPSQNQVVTFTAGVFAATADMQYNWTVPTGWFINGGQGTNSIQVLVGNTAGQVNLSVKNNCGNTATGSHTVTFRNNCGTTLPECPNLSVSLDGPMEVCAFADEPVIYTANVTNGSPDQEFIWSVPADWFIVAGENTNTIAVLVGFESGSVAVTVRNNACNNSVSANRGVLALEDCSGLGVLPVEFLSFAGESMKDGVLLQWVTATEKDNDRFELERSSDGQNFLKVGQVKGNGNSNTKRTYALRDIRAEKGTHYYRLKQIDFNGEFEYSKIVAVNHMFGALAAQMVMAPNPVSNGQFNLSLPQAATDATVQLLDMQGRVLHTQQLEAGSTDVNISTNNLRPGMYLIKLQDGSQHSQGRLIVK